MSDLLPCPFCGSTGPSLKSTTTVAGVCRAMGFAVACDQCSAQFPGSMSPDAAIKAWNRRADSGVHCTGHVDYDPPAGSGKPTCPCYACTPDQPGAWAFRIMMRLCPTCGNKRCPHASDHRHACTNSNEPGQPGSIYE